MRRMGIVVCLSLLCLSACSGRYVVSGSSAPSPEPPHPVQGPVASLGIPPGHYPPQGQCRVWIPGRPPGQQARPVPCDSLGDIPTGAWVLHRPRGDKKVVEVTAYDESRPTIVVSVSCYDAKSGAFLRAGSAE